jgi:hypothetical protein
MEIRFLRFDSIRISLTLTASVEREMWEAKGKGESPTQMVGKGTSDYDGRVNGNVNSCKPRQE